MVVVESVHVESISSECESSTYMGEVGGIIIGLMLVDEVVDTHGRKHEASL